MGELPQEELLLQLQKAKGGDKAAFETLYQEFFLPVYRYILKRVQDKTTSEDLTQTVFFKVYTSRTSFEDRSISPLAYFFTIARNAVSDHFKKTQSPLSIHDEYIDISDPHTFTETIEKRNQIMKAFEHLEQTQRQILHMKFFEGFSTEEIAIKLEMTRDNIRQIQCRALKKLREILPYE